MVMSGSSGCSSGAPSGRGCSSRCRSSRSLSECDLVSGFGRRCLPTHLRDLSAFDTRAPVFRSWCTPTRAWFRRHVLRLLRRGGLEDLSRLRTQRGTLAQASPARYQRLGPGSLRAMTVTRAPLCCPNAGGRHSTRSNNRDAFPGETSSSRDRRRSVSEHLGRNLRKRFGPPGDVSATRIGRDDNAISEDAGVRG